MEMSTRFSNNSTKFTLFNISSSSCMANLRQPSFTHNSSNKGELPRRTPYCHTHHSPQLAHLVPQEEEGWSLIKTNR